VTDEPTDRPAFLDKERAESTPYAGAPGAEPTFDDELAAWNDPDYTEEIPPGGKGPSRGYQERWRAIARLHALGQSSTSIGKKLGYSPAGVSLALKQPFVQAEVARYREQYESDITSRVKDAALDGIERIHKIILDPAEKSQVALDASKWAVEKITGKPKQEVSVESGTISTFMDMLKEMKRRSEPLDVTPVQIPAATAGPQANEESPDAVPQQNRWSGWSKSNL
jgi:hypothetical protein